MIGPCARCGPPDEPLHLDSKGGWCCATCVFNDITESEES